MGNQPRKGGARVKRDMAERGITKELDMCSSDMAMSRT